MAKDKSKTDEKAPDPVAPDAPVAPDLEAPNAQPLETDPALDPASPAPSEEETIKAPDAPAAQVAPVEDAPVETPKEVKLTETGVPAFDLDSDKLPHPEK